MATRKTPRGFSLVELILSIGIIGTSLILVAGIFTMLFSGSQKATDLTAGSVVADGLLAQHIYQVMAVDSVRNAFFASTQYATPQVYRGGTYSLNNTVYFYKIYCQDVDLGSYFHNTETDSTRGYTCIRRFDITVWWNDASAASTTNAQQMTMRQQAREGVGRQEVHQVRLVWPNGAY